MAQFDFTESFEKIGKIFAKGLRETMLDQVDISGSQFARPAQSTLKARQTGKNKKSAIGRMHVTGNTANEAFTYEATKNGVKIKVSTKHHRGSSGSDKRSNPTYKQLIEWNSKGQPKLNPYVGGNAPLIFPTNKNEVLMMTREFEQAKKIFAKDAKEQMGKMADTKMKVVLNIG